MKSSTWFPLFSALACGRWRSSESLGFELSITRAAVRQSVSYLRDLGVQIDDFEQGYRIKGGVYLPDIDWLTKHLGYRVGLVPEIESTNSYLLNHGFENQVLMTLHQTFGRGRRGRSWIDVPGKSLMLSMGLFSDRLSSPVSLLPIAVGTKLCAYLNELTIPAKLKWPNDIWIDDRKLAGFLIEIRGDFQGRPYIVIGLGLNLGLPIKKNLDLASIDPYLVWSDDHTLQLLDNLRSAFFTLPEMSSDEIQKMYRRVSLLDNREVIAFSESEYEYGVAQGIDEFGRLRILTDRGLVVVSAGDVSVRPKH